MNHYLHHIIISNTSIQFFIKDNLDEAIFFLHNCMADTGLDLHVWTVLQYMCLLLVKKMTERLYFNSFSVCGVYVCEYAVSLSIGMYCIQLNPYNTGILPKVS